MKPEPSNNIHSLIPIWCVLSVNIEYEISARINFRPPYMSECYVFSRYIGFKYKALSWITFKVIHAKICLVVGFPMYLSYIVLMSNTNRRLSSIDEMLFRLNTVYSSHTLLCTQNAYIHDRLLCLFLNSLNPFWEKRHEEIETLTLTFQNHSRSK